MSRELTSSDILALSNSDESPLWWLLMDTLTQSIENEIEGAVGEAIPSEARHYNSGRAASLMELKRHLLSLKEDAIKHLS